MTLRILKSQLPADFHALVLAHLQAKLDHRFTVGVAAPVAHPLVEAAVRRVPHDGQADDFVVDYELVDDSPPPKSLRERKDDLLTAVVRQEKELLVSSLPPGKRRLDGYLHRDILAKAEDQRTAAEAKYLAERAARVRREEAVARRAAELMAQIEDLTEATIGAWSAAPFPT